MPFDVSSGRTEAGRGVPRSTLSLLLVCVFTFFLGLGRPAITDSDEAYYAEASREMVESGDWLTPHFNYEDRWAKPVLYYWLTAAAYELFGPGEWAARAWAALSGIGLVLLTFSAARRITGSDDTAWLAGAITATSLGYFSMARVALPDLPLTLCITLTIWAALRALTSAPGESGARLQWTIAGIAAGAGLLLKGPVALAIPVVVLVPILLLERHRIRLEPLGLVIAALVCAAVALPWYIAMWREHGNAYLQSFFVGDNLARFTSERFNDARPLWYYLPVLIGGMLPWSIYLIILPVRPALDVVSRVRRLTDVEWRLILWAAMPLLFYTASIGKQPRYILPVLPPLAILLAKSVARRIAMTEDPAARPQPALSAATASTAVLFALLAIAVARMQPVLINTDPQVVWAGAIAIGAAGLAIGALALTRAWRRLPAVMTAAGVVFLMTFQFCVVVGQRPEPVEQMAALVKTHRTTSEPLGTYQAFVRNLVFYTHQKQVDLYDLDGVAAFIDSPERVLLVISDQDLRQLEALSKVTMQRLGEVQYLNTANIRLRTLIRPDPLSEIQRVLLVSNR